jgi:hypothetical protein
MARAVAPHADERSRAEPTVLAVPHGTHSTIWYSQYHRAPTALEYPEYLRVPAWPHSAAEHRVVVPSRCACVGESTQSLTVGWLADRRARWKGIDTCLDYGRDMPHVDARERHLLHAVMRRCLRYADAVLGRTGLDVGPSVQ